MYFYFSATKMSATDPAFKSVNRNVAGFYIWRIEVNTPGASCSKLTMSLVNDSLKFQMAILQIHFYYTPGIYADGYIVFAFPFVRSFLRS